MNPIIQYLLLSVAESLKVNVLFSALIATSSFSEESNLIEVFQSSLLKLRENAHFNRFELRALAGNIPLEFVDLTQYEIVALAHELGHAVSSRRKIVPQDKMNEAYSKLNAGRELTDDESCLIYREEERAWRFATVLLNYIGFNQMSLVEDEKQRCLLAYKNTLVKLVG